MTKAQVINTNVLSLKAQRNKQTTQSSLATALQPGVTRRQQRVLLAHLPRDLKEVYGLRPRGEKRDIDLAACDRLDEGEQVGRIHVAEALSYRRQPPRN